MPPLSASKIAPATAATRRLWVAGLATGAIAGAGGWAWWVSPPPAPSSAAPASLWQQTFETPEGASLVLSAFQGRPLLLNFWATWCPPCIAELPLLNDFFRQNTANGWQVLGIAVDQAPAVRAFLARKPLDFPVAMAGLTGTELARSLGNLGGGLPFTVVLSADGQMLHRKIGQITAENLQQWAVLR